MSLDPRPSWPVSLSLPGLVAKFVRSVLNKRGDVGLARRSRYGKVYRTRTENFHPLMKFILEAVRGMPLFSWGLRAKIHITKVKNGKERL